LRHGARVVPRVGIELAGSALAGHPCAAVAVADCPWFLVEHGRWQVTSVGAAGMTLAGDTPLLAGAEIELELHPPGGGARRPGGGAAGRRARAGAGVAVEWVAPDTALLRAIARFLLAQDAAL